MKILVKRTIKVPREIEKELISKAGSQAALARAMGVPAKDSLCVGSFLVHEKRNAKPASFLDACRVLGVKLPKELSEDLEYALKDCSSYE